MLGVERVSNKHSYKKFSLPVYSLKSDNRGIPHLLELKKYFHQDQIQKLLYQTCAEKYISTSVRQNPKTVLGTNSLSYTRLGHHISPQL